MAVTKTIEHKFKIGTLQLVSLLRRLADLSKISDMVKLKIDGDVTLIYSVVTIGQHINVFKAATLQTDELFDEWDKKILNEPVDFIILKSKALVKNCEFFVQNKSSVDIKLIGRDGLRCASRMFLDDDTLSLEIPGGNPKDIKDVSAQMIKDKMDPSFCNFSFNVSGDTMAKIKKLANNSKSESVTITIKDEILYFSDKETGWKLQLGDVPADDCEMVFAKKHLSSFEDADKFDINMFDHFMVIVQGNTYLMIGLELNDL